MRIMIERFKLLFAAAALCSALPILAQEISTQIRPSVTATRPGGPVDLVQLREELEIAPANDRFSIDLRMPDLVPLGPLRELLERLSVQRAVATVPVGNGISMIGIGTFYERERAWNYGVCRTLASAGLIGVNTYSETPPEKWLSSNLVVYASAHALRELLADPLLQGAELLDGNRQRMSNDERFAQIVRRESDQVIETPANVQLPGFCRPFLGFQDSPVLSGNYLRQSAEDGGLNSEALLARQLSERPGDTPVTLSLKFQEPQSAAALARFVEAYDIDGLYTNLSPIGNDRIAVDAALSIHGDGPQQQAQSVDCVARLNNPAPSTEWRTTQAQVSVTVAKAWQVASSQDVYDLRMVSSFAPGDLERLKTYYEQLVTTGMEVPATVSIPAGCERYLKRAN